jgi:hypothetical protein
VKITIKQHKVVSFLFPGLLLIASCKKTDTPLVQSNETGTYSSEVAQKWMDLELRFLRISGANIFGMNGNRNFAYTGIALYEAVLPGMPGYQSLAGQLTDMPRMPAVEPNKKYHWPTSANAALSFIIKNLYATNISDAYKASIDSLETALNTTYQTEIADAETFQRSVNFGKAVAQKIFDWSKTDGSLASYPAFVNSTVVSAWTPTAPNPTTPFAPNWGSNRQFVQGSFNGTSSPLPPAYSTDRGSDYYKMVKEVYDVSQTLTDEQKACALYYRDNPGFQSGTHYICIFEQVMQTENPRVDFYAVAMAKVGISIAEAQINCWKIKYTTLVDRPTRYIREVMGYTSWSPFLSTPGHPDFPSGHSQTGGAFATAMSSIFGNNYKITLHTYDNLGMARRSYNSFNEMADDIGKSRVYAGIHYTYSCVEGCKQGNKIAANVLSTLKFK